MLPILLLLHNVPQGNTVLSCSHQQIKPELWPKGVNMLAENSVNNFQIDTEMCYDWFVPCQLTGLSCS